LDTRKASINGQSPSITKKKSHKKSILQSSQLSQLESIKKQRKRSTSKKPMTEAKSVSKSKRKKRKSQGR